MRFPSPSTPSTAGISCRLLGRRKYDDTKELQRKEAADQIRASKVDEETELWLRRLRDDAYVDLKS